ncbi:MAG: phosphoribosyltransferase [Acidobacteria bacterium]|nr:MAG: phosphoribosyltransferase [Acidobacteriota bacterium]
MFRNRFEAGSQLAELLEDYAQKETCLLAIPRGGIEIGHPIALRLKKPLDVIIPRKIPCPDNPELALGAVTIDGGIEINQPLVAELGLTVSDIEKLINPVQAEIQRRLAVYRGNKPGPGLQGKNVILIDDGLATGYTMMAGIRSARRQSPDRIIVAVPVSPASTYERVREAADELVVLHLARDRFFTVSGFYQNFRDLRDEELTQLLEQCNQGPSEGLGASSGKP